MKRLNTVSDVMQKNQEFADRIRAMMSEKKALMLNVMASPGAGKTSLISSIAKVIGGKASIFVIEGDLATSLDKDRLESLGIRAYQVNTVSMCHLTARHVVEALELSSNPGFDILFVENVGNLVCPSEYDLGEDIRMVVASVPEGDDKPLKYPRMFARSDVVVLNKADLLGALDFEIDMFKSGLARINSGVPLFVVSCKTGDGIEELAAWILQALRKKKERLKSSCSDARPKGEATQHMG